ncbi:MarC family protein [uncultured Nevskia sp.]|uniref:MarC family protein n=1 Tax=uncultured Nevskia sp. TaxID=228950 RepID=UPI0025DD14A0|nr:MarC family protein [uncultured Nevskia sp.]
MLTFIGLLPIINPVESAPVFAHLTKRCTQQQRHTLARQVAVGSFLLLLGSMLLGPWLLKFFGIELPVVRIAGGLVIVSIGWKVFNKDDGQLSGITEARNTKTPPGPIRSFYPLTMPLTAGPGSMSVAIAIGSSKPDGAHQLSQWLLHTIGAVIGLAGIAVMVCVCYRYADRIVRLLGETGADALVRLSAFILICIGVQIVWDGYSALLATAAR